MKKQRKNLYVLLISVLLVSALFSCGNSTKYPGEKGYGLWLEEDGNISFRASVDVPRNSKGEIKTDDGTVSFVIEWGKNGNFVARSDRDKDKTLFAGTYHITADDLNRGEFTLEIKSWTNDPLFDKKTLVFKYQDNT